MSRLAKLAKLHASDPEDTDILYMLAQEHASAGDHAAAIAWYDRCLARDPLYLYAYFHKARSLEAMERSADAAQVLRTGLEHARRKGDAKAVSELAAYLDQLPGD